MTETNNFKFKIAERNLENYALPPDDPLGELSDFEFGLRRFCYESPELSAFQGLLLLQDEG